MNKNPTVISENFTDRNVNSLVLIHKKNLAIKELGHTNKKIKMIS